MMNQITRACIAIACVLVLAGCESKVTQENYDKITVGMSLAQVEEILGSGEPQDSSGTSIESSGLTSGANVNPDAKTYVWQSEGKQIIVNFMKDKVVSKNKRGL